MERRGFITGTLCMLVSACASRNTPAPSTAQSGRRFSPEERSVIEAFYNRTRSRGPQQTPPQPRVRLGDKLPSGERPSKLPTDLDRLLQPLPAPYARLVLGAEVLLVNHDTHDIEDLIAQVAY